MCTITFVQYVWVGATAAAVVVLICATWFQVKGLRSNPPRLPTEWAIWAAVVGVSGAAQFFAGARGFDLAMPAVQWLSAIALLIVGTFRYVRKYGVRGQRWQRLKRHEKVALWCCVVGVVASVMSHEPFVALIGNALANVASVVPVWRQASKDASSVTRIYWRLRILSTTLAATAVLAHAPQLSLSVLLSLAVPQLVGVAVALSVLGVTHYYNTRSVMMDLYLRKLLLSEEPAPESPRQPQAAVV